MFYFVERERIPLIEIRAFFSTDADILLQSGVSCRSCLVEGEFEQANDKYSCSPTPCFTTIILFITRRCNDTGMMAELRRSPIRDCILKSLEYCVSQIVWVVCLDTLVGSELEVITRWSDWDGWGEWIGERCWEWGCSALCCVVWTWLMGWDWWDRQFCGRVGDCVVIVEWLCFGSH